MTDYNTSDWPALPPMSTLVNQVHCMDVLELLKLMPDESVNCIVTSPPYFGLRDYGVDGQIGGETTPTEYVQKLVTVFREARRVLRSDGVFWLNLGDSYAQDKKWGGSTSGKHTSKLHGKSGVGRNRHLTGLPGKNIIGIPWRVAFALQEDGWILRSDIIWAKPNPMPESVTDRPTKSHEYIFLFAKSSKKNFYTHKHRSYLDGFLHQRTLPTPDYLYKDNLTGLETCTEPADWRNDKLPNSKKRWSRINLWIGHDYYYDADAIKEPAQDWGTRDRSKGKYHNEGTGLQPHAGLKGTPKQDQLGNRRYTGFNERWDNQDPPLTRNKRSVWMVSPAQTKESHFATFPHDLITPMILAGCPNGGIVYDPFMGSGTTAIVARALGRQFIGSDLNPHYVMNIANRRLSKPYQVRDGLLSLVEK